MSNFLFPISTVALLGCAVVAYLRGGRRNALSLALSVWLFEIVLLSVPLFVFEVEYSLQADLLLAAALTATTMAYVVVRRVSASPRGVYPGRRQEILVTYVLGGIGLVGCLLLLIDARSRGTSISLGFLLENLAQVRESANDPLAQALLGARPLFFVGLYMAACAYLSVLAAVKLGGRANRMITALGVANLVGLGLVSLFVFAGRTILVNAVLLALVSLMLSGRALRIRNPRTVIVIGFLCIGGWFFSVSYFGAREQTVDVDSYLMNLQRAHLAPWVSQVAREQPAVGLALINLGYFASPLPTLSWYIQQRPLPGPYFGGYSYPLPARTVAKIWGSSEADRWSDIRREVFAPLESRGYAGNVWATWLRDLLIDFGYLGTVLFCGLFGGFMAWARNRFDATGALHYHYFEALACFTLAFGAFQNLLWVNIYSNVFFVAVLAMVAVRLQVGRGRVSYSRRPDPITTSS